MNEVDLIQFQQEVRLMAGKHLSIKRFREKVEQRPDKPFFLLRTAAMLHHPEVKKKQGLAGVQS